MSTYFFALTIITLIAAFCQLLLAIYAHKRIESTRHFFNIPLTSHTTGAELVEKYVRIYRSIPVQVNAGIRNHAHADGDKLAINRSFVYQKDLYTNIVIATQISLTKQKFHGLQHNYLFEFFFLIEIISLGLALGINNFIPLLFAALLALLLIASSFYRQASFSFVTKDVLDFGTDLLNLDHTEQVVAKQLLGIHSGRVLTYPVSAITRTVKFLLP